MQIFLQEFSPTLLQQAELHFSPDFLASLHPPHLDQKKIKNLILQELFDLSEEQLHSANQSYCWDSKFFSASYTDEYLLLSIADQKIGVDLEQIRPRSSTLLANYQQELEKIFGKADWSGFYLLWTAREAILKASDTADLDQMEEIFFLSLHPKKIVYWKLPFTWEISFSYLGREWLVFAHQEKDLLYSICMA